MNNAYANTAATLPETDSELINIQKRLSNQNSDYVSLLNTIQQKLHDILNLRQPEPEQKGIDKPINQDFVSYMHEQLTFMQMHNQKLNQVLEHIIKIIG